MRRVFMGICIGCSIRETYEQRCLARCPVSTSIPSPEIPTSIHQRGVHVGRHAHRNDPTGLLSSLAASQGLFGAAQLLDHLLGGV